MNVNCRALSLVVALILLHSSLPIASADLPAPNRKYLFRADERKAKQERGVHVATKAIGPQSGDLDMKAPSVEFEKDQQTARVKGGVILSRPGLTAQADEGLVNLTTKQGKLSGKVLIATPDVAIQAEQADLNFDSETGTFTKSEMTLEDGGYQVDAAETKKLSEFEYQLTSCGLTTCACEDKSKPWKISSTRAHITQESYAHTYGSTLDVYGVPVLYTPYLAFPVKQERQSGLLIPSFGYSDEDGVELSVPVFAVLDDHTDMTFEPFVQSHTRTGLAYEFRKSFSDLHNVQANLVFSNESQRGDDLRGTNTTNLFDPTFEENRFAFRYDHQWRTRPSDDLNLSFIADVRHIGDDLMLRELELGSIGDRNDRFVTSRALFRGGLGDYGLAELSGEFNEALLSDDDLVFQRLPELNVYLGRSVRPFGFNPYGLKLVGRTRIYATEFSRDTGYDGSRVDVYPSVSVPFHWKNYLSSELEVGVHKTWYRLDETFVPEQCADPDAPGCTRLDDSNDRTLGTVGFRLSTGLERAYDVERDSWLTQLTGLGVSGAGSTLTRIKHTIEPAVRFLYVPKTSDDDLPLFDSLDRLRPRSVFVYGFKTSLAGRFQPNDRDTSSITELTPEVEDLPVYRADEPLAFGQSAVPALGPSGRRTSGDVRNLAVLSVRQSYDYREDQDDLDPSANAFSDIATSLELYPHRNFGLSFDGNVDYESGDLSSWSVLSQVLTDRGDAARLRYTFIDESVSQIEGNLELVLTDRLRFGYYARYDHNEGEFIENEGALRLASRCNCWYVDLGFNNRINPDRNLVTLRFTLAGLGDFAQSFSAGQRSR